jgi:hypothetical protein
MVPFPVVSSLYIPWDFVLILLFLGIVIPWRGSVRMRRLMSKPGLSTSDRLSLYGSTIFFQWLLVAIVGYRCFVRSVSPGELGLVAGDPWKVALISCGLTGLLCLNQVMGLRRIEFAGGPTWICFRNYREDHATCPI